MNRKARRWSVGLLSAALLATVGGPTATANAADSAPVRLLVGLKPGYDANAKLDTLARLGLQSAEAQGRSRSGRLAAIGAKALTVPSGRVALTLAALRRDPAVAYASIDTRRKVADVVAPNDYLYTTGNQPELGQIKVPAAWQTTTGSEVVVAVVDSGVTAVGDLAGQVMPGIDFVNFDNDAQDGGDYPHGTVVASLIAGKANNAEGMAGVCWQCKIMPVRVMGSDGWGEDSTIALGIIYAVDNGAQIINLSLGGAGYSKALADAVAYANNHSVLVVAAAGNENTDRKSYPAALPDVLAVGGTNTLAGGNSRVYFSNYSTSWVDVAAPAITAGMFKDGSYQYGGNAVKGTSFSSPLVAGVAALVKSAHPEYNGWSLQHAIVSSTVPGTQNTWTHYGLVDAAKALTIGTDTSLPTVGYLSPGQNAKVHGSVAITPVGVNGTGSGILKTELYVDGRWHSSSYVSPYAPKLNTGTRNGPITVKMKLTDKAGNVSWSGERTVIAENIKPKVVLSSAKKNKAKVSGTVNVYAKASDASGISRVQLLVNGKVVATDYTAGYKLSFKVKSQAKTMKIQLRAYDKVGNFTTTSVLRTYYRA